MDSLFEQLMTNIASELNIEQEVFAKVWSTAWAKTSKQDFTSNSKQEETVKCKQVLKNGKNCPYKSTKDGLCGRHCVKENNNKEESDQVKKQKVKKQRKQIEEEKEEEKENIPQLEKDIDTVVESIKSHQYNKIYFNNFKEHFKNKDVSNLELATIIAIVQNKLDFTRQAYSATDQVFYLDTKLDRGSRTFIQRTSCKVFRLFTQHKEKSITLSSLITEIVKEDDIKEKMTLASILRLLVKNNKISFDLTTLSFKYVKPAEKKKDSNMFDFSSDPVDMSDTKWWKMGKLKDPVTNTTYDHHKITDLVFKRNDDNISLFGILVDCELICVENMPEHILEWCNSCGIEIPQQ
jgi:hypothetical protein